MFATFIKSISDNWSRDWNREAKMKLDYLKWVKFQRELEAMDEMEGPREL